MVEERASITSANESMHKIVKSLLVFCAYLRPRFDRPLDDRAIKKTMAENIPAGTPKGQVIEWLRTVPAIYRDNRGRSLETRLMGQAPDRVYTLNIAITFDFDAEQRLVGYSFDPWLYFL